MKKPAAKKRWWVSWNEYSPDYRPIHDPPRAAVLAWWCSGSAGDDSHFTLCAVVEAVDEEKAKNAIINDWPPLRPDVNDIWRFCEEKPASWLPGDRFPVEPGSWEEKRLKK